MGRLFTYMVKAAAGEQPAPGPEYYQFRTPNLPGKGVAYQPSAWNEFKAYFGHLPFTSGTERDLAQQANFAKRMYDASRSDDAAAFFKMPGAADYVTSFNSKFTSPAAIYEYLDARPEYQAALKQLADKGSWDGLKRIWSTAGDAPGMTDPIFGWRPDYQLSDGAGNAQLILNMYLAEKARRDQEAQQQQEAQPKKPAPQPTAAAPKPATAPVQAPAPPNSSAAAAPAKKIFSPLWPMVRNVAQQVRYALQPELKVRDTIQQNIDAGRSMYDGMTTSTPGMTAGQKHALTTHGFVGTWPQQNAATRAAMENAYKRGQTHVPSEHEAYTGAGLRMVGHSADGKTRTYVGRSGRGRITVGDNAQAGHYRGVGAADTNPRSNYANLRQPATTRPVTPPNARKSTTAPRR